MAANPVALGITATANRLGMDPVDLATIISYETGGTFDPSQAGPTTKWGQHRGLIQFGEPQAQQYGVNWDDPLNSQLGEGGAVEKYFLDRGWKPGMSQLDAYSIVNAGAPGKYNAVDGDTTVQQKVASFAPHREKASTFLGMPGGAVASATGTGVGSSSIAGAPTGFTGEGVTPEMLEKYGLLPGREPYWMKNTANTGGLTDFTSGQQVSIQQPGVQDIGILANIITPNRDVRAKAVLDNLKAFS